MQWPGLNYRKTRAQQPVSAGTTIRDVVNLTALIKYNAIEHLQKYFCVFVQEFLQKLSISSHSQPFVAYTLLIRQGPSVKLLKLQTSYIQSFAVNTCWQHHSHLQHFIFLPSGMSQYIHCDATHTEIVYRCIPLSWMIANNNRLSQYSILYSLWHGILFCTRRMIVIVR